MVRAESKFEKYSIKVGDIHPANILINKQGLIKIISTISLPKQGTNFEKYIQQRAKVYLAPQQLHFISTGNREYPQNVDPNLAECFSIGLTMLSAATLEDASKIYEQRGQKLVINRGQLNLFLKQFGEKYSSLLSSYVFGLVAQNPAQRKKASEIHNSLFQYQECILNFESFMPQNSRYFRTSHRNSYQNKVVNSRATQLGPNYDIQYRSPNSNYQQGYNYYPGRNI